MAQGSVVNCKGIYQKDTHVQHSLFAKLGILAIFLIAITTAMFISSFISLSKTAWNLFYLFRNILFEIYHKIHNTDLIKRMN